jgi:hypothetical protein
MKKHLCAVLATATMMVATPLVAQTTVVNGNGTVFTASGGGSDDPSCSASYDTWCGRNVRSNASVGETTARPRSGNGSLAFTSPDGNGKADFEYYLSPPNMFKLNTLQNMSYDYFRSSSSSVAGHLVPALRIIIQQNGSTASLVYEPVYNGQNSATTDAWTNELIGGTTNVWLSEVGCGIQQVYNITLSTWQSSTGSAANCPGHLNFNGNATVIGFSTGVGSGWAGTFDGAVDNVSFETSGMNQARTFNFEVAGQSVVPEPSTYLLMAAGLGFVGVAARRRKTRA